MQNNNWARLLAYVTGLVNHRLLLQCEYLVAENRILRSQLPSKLRLTHSERRTLAEIGKRLGRKLLSDVACVAKPETILGWYRRLIARKFDGSKHRSYAGRPRINPEIEELIVRVAQENATWGYDRIAGALANLGHRVSDQTVGNVLRRHGIPTAPKRNQTTTWKDFISAHMAVLAGTDFFTVEVLTWRGLATYYVLFFLNLESRRITLAGITRHQRKPGLLRWHVMQLMTVLERFSALSLRAPRPGWQILCGVRRRLGVRGHACSPAPAAQPESECVRYYRVLRRLKKKEHDKTGNATADALSSFSKRVCAFWTRSKRAAGLQSSETL